MNFLRVGFDIGTVSGMRYPTGSMKPSRAAAALQPVLEKSRLELRALFRTLDRLHLAQELPAELRVLLEVDADFAEALHVLKQAPRNIDWGAMERDTRASLARVSVVREALLATFDAPTRIILEARAEALRRDLSPQEAYRDIPEGP